MDDETREKALFLKSKGLQYISGRDIWISKAGELSREFVDDNLLTEIKRKLSKAEKVSQVKNEPFKLVNN